MYTQDLDVEHQRRRAVWRMEARARRAARRVGLVARKSRWRVGTPDNCGGFAIIDPSTNFILDGWRYDLEPEDVVELANADTESEEASSKQEAV